MSSFQHIYLDSRDLDARTGVCVSPVLCASPERRLPELCRYVCAWASHTPSSLWSCEVVTASNVERKSLLGIQLLMMVHLFAMESFY
jgi:hypothetical protein